MAKPTKQLTTTLDWAKEYIRLGLPVLPCYAVKPDGDCTCPPNSKERKHEDPEDHSCKTPGKHPVSRLVPNGSKGASTDLDQIRRWFAKDGEYNIAIATGKNKHGNLMVVDLDITPDKETGLPKDGPGVWKALAAEIGPFSDTLLQITGSGGRQLFWWTTDEVPMNQETKLGAGIDIRGKSGYVVVPPSVNRIGPYKWENWTGHLHTIQKAPSPLEDRARSGPRRASLVTAAPGAAAAPDTEPKDDPRDKLTLPQVLELLQRIPPGKREDWLEVGCILKTIAVWIGGEPVAFETWDRWAQPGKGYCGAADQQYQWASFSPTRHPIALLRKHARAHGWTPSEEFQREGYRWRSEAAHKLLEALTAESSAEDVRSLLALIAGLPVLDQDLFLNDIKKRTNGRFSIKPLRNELAGLQTKHLGSSEGETDYGVIVAKRVLVKHYNEGKHLINAADGFFWYYNGRCWEQITNENEIGNLCLAATLELGPIKKDVDVVVRQAANLLADFQAVGGDVLRLAQPPLSVVNCLNGELWIKDDFTVELRDHNPESYLRFCLDINYDPIAKCPMFDKALLEIFQESPDPEDMRRHMYEVFGYTIQPRRFIKIFMLWKGSGDNGKSKVVEVLIELVGKKAVAPGRIQQLGKSEYHQANLKCKLLFRDDDVEHNTILPDGILKQYSEAKFSNGRDPYGRVSEFVVCIVPIMLCNDYPITKDLSQGTLQRAHVIPFRHQFIMDVDRDETLFERIIKNEMSGILNRAIEGLQRLMVRKHFLEPADCLAAKAEFLNASNPLPQFISSGWCISTVEGEIANVTADATLELQAAIKAGNRARAEKLEGEIAIAAAKAEKDGLKGINQTTQDFYNNFILYCRNEGNEWKPKKSAVERDLVHLKYPVSNQSGQLRVYGLRSMKVTDQTPVRPM